MLSGKILLDNTNLFSLNDYIMNGKIINKKINMTSLDFRLKKIKQETFRGNKAMISWVKSIKGFQRFKLLSNFPFFHFCCQWLFFNSAFALLVGIPGCKLRVLQYH